MAAWPDVTSRTWQHGLQIELALTERLPQPLLIAYLVNLLQTQQKQRIVPTLTQRSRQLTQRHHVAAQSMRRQLRDVRLDQRHIGLQ